MYYMTKLPPPRLNDKIVWKFSMKTHINYTLIYTLVMFLTILVTYWLKYSAFYSQSKKSLITLPIWHVIYLVINKHGNQGHQWVAIFLKAQNSNWLNVSVVHLKKNYCILDFHVCFILFIIQCGILCKNFMFIYAVVF